jgi:hypothetical protein
LEEVRSELAVQIVPLGDELTPEPAESGDVAGEDDGGADEDVALVVDVAEVAGEDRSPRLGVFDEQQQLIGLVPTTSYGDVRSILDTGVPTRNVLRSRLLEIALTAGATE